MNQWRGTVGAISGGVLWGISGVMGQFLFSGYEINPEWLTAVRMTLAGVILTTYGLVAKRKEIKGILTSKQDLISLLVFSIFGLLFCQLTFLKAIFYSNAATATILQYLGPVMIMGATCVMHRRFPAKTEWICGCLAVAGTYLLATGGKADSMSLTVAGLLWGILSAGGMALYSMLPRGLMKRWGSMPVSGLGMLIGGLVMCLYCRIWQQPVSLDFYGWIVLTGVCFLGTVLAYSVYLYGIKEVGAVKAGLLCCSEPLSSALLMAIWLGVPMNMAEWIGFLMILATVFLSAEMKESIPK
ncbi:MAG: EamA family transporter [Ruminococcaceae bacterium]|nr:EamA family transporter [Oscillospiraceae bacterium]